MKFGDATGLKDACIILEAAVHGTSKLPNHAHAELDHTLTIRPHLARYLLQILARQRRQALYRPFNVNTPNANAPNPQQ
jgi:hypothetical protein